MLFMINKENVDELIDNLYSLKKPIRDKVIDNVNALFDVNEVLEQMESDTINYTIDEYLQAKDLKSMLLNDICNDCSKLKW